LLFPQKTADCIAKQNARSYQPAVSVIRYPITDSDQIAYPASQETPRAKTSSFNLL